MTKEEAMWCIGRSVKSDVNMAKIADAIKAIEQEQYYKTLAESYEKTINKLIKAISEQGSRKGHWIPYLKKGLTVKCSECKSRFSLGYNYCPNCGADMRGVK